MGRTRQEIYTWTLPDIDLAQLCKEVRAEAGLTQVEIAKLLGTTPRSYRRWEYGEIEPAGQFTAKLLALRDQLRKLTA